MYICLIGLERHWSRVKAIKQNSNTLVIFIYISESTQFCSNLINIWSSCSSCESTNFNKLKAPVLEVE